jgi:transcription-repair coupling factor (superfamily II helicase)
MILQKLLRDITRLDNYPILQKLITDGAKTISIGGLTDSARTMIIASIYQTVQRPALVVAQDSEAAEKIADDLKSFLGDGPVHLFPSWGISPFEIRAPHNEIIGQRLLTLYNLTNNRPLVIVASVEAVLEPTIPRDQLLKYSLRITKGDKLDRDQLVRLLEKLDYKRTAMTEMLGEYSVRGGLIDIFAPTGEDPFRIEFFDNEIESIRHFSVLTQRSTRQIDHAVILPRREIIVEQSAIEDFSQRLPENQAQALHVALGDSGDRDGLEFLWPNLELNMEGILEHLDNSTIVFIDDPRFCFDNVKSFLEDAEIRFGEINDTPFARPERIYLTGNQITAGLANFPAINLVTTGNPTDVDFYIKSLPQEFFGTNLAHFKSRLSEISQEGYEINILCDSPGQKDRVAEFLEDVGFPVNLHIARLTSGFAIPGLKQWYFADHLIFTRYKQRRPFRKFKEGVAISSYTSLNPGDYVVHIDYGIGKFLGLETLVVDGRKRDCIALIYLGDDKLYVPIEEFNRVQKYAGKDGAPRLSKLGSGTWERAKARTKKALLDMAGELISLYAERQAFPGFAFKPDSEWMRQLEASFAYQETPDQLTTMEQIRADMEKPTPMDRIICGDVGYGKTELAIRAALKAVDSGKQVALLAPTTILTAQHMETFSDRLAVFPIKIAMLSRFRSPKEVKETKAGLADGTVDIVIGTHKLLSKDVKFKDLGLLIVDEEQHFGVAHKEKLKKLRAQIDVLTLTATPIPRTLQLSLSGARDMSVINTPPKDRFPIATEVTPFSDRVIVDAVNRELDRGGQVFIVHNRVQSIMAFYNYLKNLLPLVKIAVGHGQMPEHDLEKVMKSFLEKKYQVLLSTTIIESGLDIPSVNTIIINRADKLGLAQLYQLRGRVGRSHYRAYAHLLIPPYRLLNPQARKRLKAIEEFTELGSGFHLAMRDLEIRGAGNILGAQQHGFIEEVGFDLYVKLLEETVAQLKGKSIEEHLSDIKVTTDIDLFLPENYISDSHQRVDVYRRFAAASDIDAIEDLLTELEDRFGPPPDAIANLADISTLKILGKKLKVESIQLKGRRLILEFGENSSPTRDIIGRWVKVLAERLEFKYGRNLSLEITIKDSDNRADEAKKVLQKMTQ